MTREAFDDLDTEGYLLLGLEDLNQLIERERIGDLISAATIQKKLLEIATEYLRRKKKANGI